MSAYGKLVLLSINSIYMVFPVFIKKSREASYRPGYIARFLTLFKERSHKPLELAATKEVFSKCVYD